MPAARYWRIVGVETYAGGDLELSELHLYGAAGRLDAAATLTSTIAPTAGTLAALRDDNLGTTCRFAAAAVRAGGFALVWDFGAGNTADASCVWLGSATAQAMFMAGCTLQYSTDGMQWVWAANFARYAWPGAGAYAVAPTAGDLAFDKVSLLLHFDGANGSTTFADSALVPNTVTTYGGAVISTAQSKWGGASAYFDGTNNSYAAIQNSIEFDLASQEFTIDVWMYFIESGSAGSAVFGRWGTGPSTNTDFLLAILGGKLVFLAGWTGVELNAPGALPVGAWVHVAVTRSGNVWTLWQDGVAVATKTSALVIPYSPLQSLRLSRWDDQASFFKGYIDDLRVTKGVARYTANFTPPIGPFPGRAGGAALVSPTLHTADSAVQIAASAPVPAFSARRTAPLQLARDVEVGGPGAIYGTTKTKGTPNQPAKARVVLLHQRSKLPVRETWSDPVTGAFVFSGIDTSQQFLTLAEDAAGNFRPVAANRLTPEVP